jgi:hypothetical protein
MNLKMSNALMSAASVGDEHTYLMQEDFHWLAEAQPGLVPQKHPKHVSNHLRIRTRRMYGCLDFRSTLDPMGKGF